MEEHGSPAKIRRPAVGLMTGSFHTDYSRTIAQSISRALEKEEMDLYLFQGLDAARFLNVEGTVDDGFDGHYYSLFEYSKFVPIDVLIISFGTISAIPDPVGLNDFLSRLPDVPVILLEDETVVPNGTFITVDNYVGMKDCVDHLIEVHGLKNILFLAGPKGIHDADLRKSAYLDSMRAHGITVAEDMIEHGNFTDSVEPQLEALLSSYPRPEAIVCANDEMAECCYRVLRAHGLQPGKDVAVTGFDDNGTALFMDPPLTSVSQNAKNVAEESIKLVKAFLRGEKPEPVYLPAELVVRNSCFCDTVIDALRISKEKKTQKDRVKIKQLRYENMICSLTLRTLLKENITVHDFFYNLGKLLRSVGAKKSVIALLPEPLDIDGLDKLFLPERIRLHLIIDGDEIKTFSRKEAPCIDAFCAPEIKVFKEQDGVPKVVFPLFYGNMHYGVFVTSIAQADLMFYYSLSLQIGTGLKYLYMALDEQDARRALEEKNLILDFSASHDALTGLYNRAGVLNEIYNFVRAAENDSRFVAVMADIDHLKQINDTFGHSGGDRSIEEAARLLKTVLPQGSPLGRTGGDEFTALLKLDAGQDENWLKSELKRACEEFNAVSDLPFYVEISAGCCAFDASAQIDIPTRLRKADEDLYIQKKLRRASVVK